MANQHTGKHPWNDHYVELLKKLWDEGLSASQIAARLGDKFTRNAVLGKAHRMGFVIPGARTTAYGKSAQFKVQSARRRAKADRLRPPPPKVKFTVEPLPAKHVEDVARKSLADLAPDDCRFPVGDPRDEGFGFCALERRTGSPYCSAHHARAYNGLPVKTRQNPIPARETSAKETANA